MSMKQAQTGKSNDIQSRSDTIKKTSNDRSNMSKGDSTAHTSNSSSKNKGDNVEGEADWSTFVFEPGIFRFSSHFNLLQ